MQSLEAEAAIKQLGFVQRSISRRQATMADGLPTFDDACRNADNALTVINQVGQSAKNRMEDLQHEVMSYIKASNPALFAKVEATTKEIERAEAVFGTLDDACKAWFAGSGEDE